MMETAVSWIDPSRLIQASETEDEIGTVLRMHLAIKGLLKAYLSHQITAELKPYIKVPRYFGQKISLAAAFGMPVPFLGSMYEVNRIRNSLSHEAAALNESRVQQLVRQVDSIGSINENYVPLAARYVELPTKRPGEQLTLGVAGVRVDFLLASFVLFVEGSGWLADLIGPSNV